MMTTSAGSNGRHRANAPLILIVDDDAELLDVMGDALGTRSYRVMTARHGREALERIAEEEPELILLDMRMPIMDGWTFAREFHEKYGRRIPIVAITAAEDSRLRADEIGADGDLGKPFDLQQLYDVVEDALAPATNGSRTSPS